MNAVVISSVGIKRVDSHGGTQWNITEKHVIQIKSVRWNNGNASKYYKQTVKETGDLLFVSENDDRTEKWPVTFPYWLHISN